MNTKVVLRKTKLNVKENCIQAIECKSQSISIQAKEHTRNSSCISFVSIIFNPTNKIHIYGYNIKIENKGTLRHFILLSLEDSAHRQFNEFGGKEDYSEKKMDTLPFPINKLIIFKKYFFLIKMWVGDGR